ncbi:hypothetical protein CKO31_18770 [Thiohalocapsa halophila]|uniref:PEP-CTERM sorting domain-containing protein n=1 Tax=Thiohalocapsa halophila TaxID=69359 RepID=A0ABS1CLF0_9GAMM|nr:hypothetical protein [Thiohalocapsa halophila]
MIPCVAPASLVTLYDSAQGRLPQAQDWLDYAATDGIDALLTGGRTSVDTTGETAANAGFSTHSFTTNGSSASWTPKNGHLPALDARETIGLSFELRLLEESRDVDIDSRAGFTLVLLDQFLNGIEINFWSDVIWAQGSNHADPAEQADFQTDQALTRYEVGIFAGGYDVWANGTHLLGGPLRRFDADALLPGLHGTPGMIYLGDASADAASKYLLGDVKLSPRLLQSQPPPHANPTPATLALLLTGLISAVLANGFRRHRPGR